MPALTLWLRNTNMFVIGGVTGNLSTALDVGQTGIDFANDKIGAGTAAYRTGGILAGAVASSIIGGEVGSVFGPGVGTAAGTIVGGVFGIAVNGLEQAYNKMSSEIQGSFNNFINTVKSTNSYNFGR